MKQVKNYEGIIAVTRSGKIWTYARKYRTGIRGCIRRTIVGHFRKTHLDTDGYEIFTIKKLGAKEECKKVHRLVAEAFIPNPLNLKTVNHKNGIKTDNRVENLEWCSQVENMKHGWANGLFHTEAALKYYKRGKNKII